MEIRHGLISVDDHVQEHPAVWLDRLSSARWGERIPHVERAADGSEQWVVDGVPLGLAGVALAGALMADRTREPSRWVDVPRAAFTPADRLAVMDADGVDASVLYPTVAGRAGETFARLTDPELEVACTRAYNDWLVDEWAAASDRFVPQCIVPISSVDAAVVEIERAVDLGHRGVVMPSVPSDFHGLPQINEPYWDPIWRACQEAGVPVCFHAGASDRIQLLPYRGYAPALADALRALTGPASSVFVLVNFLLSRILDRFPRLRVVFPESGIAWAAYLLEYADHQYGNDKLANDGYEEKPSVLFRRNCYLTGCYENVSMRTSPFIGVENILWASHFPLATSTWPNTQGTVARWRPMVSGEQRRRMLWSNAADLYRIDVTNTPALADGRGDG